jgi:hypothetical protein
MTSPPPSSPEATAALGAAEQPSLAEAERRMRNWRGGNSYASREAFDMVMAEYDRRGRIVQSALELRTLLLDYLPTLEDRLPKDTLGPLYAALFSGPPHPLTEAEIARGQEVYAMLHPEEPCDDR